MNQCHFRLLIYSCSVVSVRRRSSPDRTGPDIDASHLDDLSIQTPKFLSNSTVFQSRKLAQLRKSMEGVSHNSGECGIAVRTRKVLWSYMPTFKQINKLFLSALF